MVAEVMLLPAAVLATGVITAVVASWMTGWLGGGRRRTDLNRVARGNLIWAILPALPALAHPYLAAQFSPFHAFLLGVTLIWTTATAVRLAFR